MGAHLTINSYGGTGARGMFDAVLRAANRQGQLFVAAAGNDGTNNDLRPVYPASHPAEIVLSITAMDPDGRLPSYANYGPNTVHLAAPGSDILSTSLDNSYTVKSGTSMAAPFGAGAAALVLAAMVEQGNASRLHGQGLRVKQVIMASAGARTRRMQSTLAGGGSVSANRAMALLAGEDLPPPRLPAEAEPTLGLEMIAVIALLGISFVMGLAALCMLIFRRGSRGG